MIWHSKLIALIDFDYVALVDNQSTETYVSFAVVVGSTRATKTMAKAVSNDPVRKTSSSPTVRVSPMAAMAHLGL